MTIYNSYIYLWYDTKAKLFYLGGHKGKVSDSYVCSSKTMLRAYKLRPHTFKLKVLQYLNGSNKDLREAEQSWLNLIQNKELMTSENVKAGSCRYYNVKKHAAGGNGSANKGNSNIGGHNKGKTGFYSHSEESRRVISEKKKEYWAKKKAAVILFQGQPPNPTELGC